MVTLGNDWLWAVSGYVMLLPTITSALGSEVNGAGIDVTVDYVDTVGGGPKGRWVDPVLWRTVDIL